MQDEVEVEMKRALKEQEHKEKLREKRLQRRFNELCLEDCIASILTRTRSEKKSIADRALQLCELLATSRKSEADSVSLGNLTRVQNRWIACSVAVWTAAMEEGYGLRWMDLQPFALSRKRFGAWRRRLATVCSLPPFPRGYQLLAYIARFTSIDTSARELDKIIEVARWIGDARVFLLKEERPRSLWCLAEFLDVVSDVPRCKDPAHKPIEVLSVHPVTLAATIVYIVLSQRGSSSFIGKYRGKVISPPPQKKRRLPQETLNQLSGVHIGSISRCKKALFELMCEHYTLYRKQKT